MRVLVTSWVVALVAVFVVGRGLGALVALACLVLPPAAYTWRARRGHRGDQVFLVYGRIAPLVAAAAAIVLGVALIPLHDWINGWYTLASWKVDLGYAAITAATIVVLQWTLLGTCHLMTFGPVLRRFDPHSLDLVRWPRKAGRRALRSAGIGLGGLAWGSVCLGGLYGWQDGGRDYIVVWGLGIGPPLLGIGVLLYLAAEGRLRPGTRPTRPIGIQVRIHERE